MGEHLDNIQIGIPILEIYKDVHFFKEWIWLHLLYYMEQDGTGGMNKNRIENYWNLYTYPVQYIFTLVNTYWHQSSQSHVPWHWLFFCPARKSVHILGAQ